jgi:hypothetical protein
MPRITPEMRLKCAKDAAEGQQFRMDFRSQEPWAAPVNRYGGSIRFYLKDFYISADGD